MAINFAARITFSHVISLAGLLTLLLLLSSCTRTPPDFRPLVTAPVYSEGDADNGALIYEETCAQCHQLTPGLNKKGPQLLNVYESSAAQLADYDYSEDLAASGWVWDAKTLDPYIADAEKALSGSKMLADPMPDAKDRADVIAYLSTLRAPVPALDAEGFPIETDKGASPTIVKDSDKQIRPLRDESIEIPEGEANKPAADYQ